MCCTTLSENNILNLLILSRSAEAGSNRGAEEVHRETSVPHPDAGDHT